MFEDNRNEDQILKVGLEIESNSDSPIKNIGEHSNCLDYMKEIDLLPSKRDGCS